MCGVGSTFAVTESHTVDSEGHCNVTLLAEGHWVQIQPLDPLFPRLAVSDTHVLPLRPPSSSPRYDHSSERLARSHEAHERAHSGVFRLTVVVQPLWGNLPAFHI